MAAKNYDVVEIRAACVSLGNSSGIISTTYCAPLNCLLVSGENGRVYVVDVRSYDILKEAVVAEESAPTSLLKLECIANSDCLLVACDRKIGMRKALNGMFLLDTILQIPMEVTSQQIIVDLQHQEAERLLKSLTRYYAPDSIFEISCESLIDQIAQYLKDTEALGHRATKWSTCLLALHADHFISLLVDLMRTMEKRVRSSIPLISSLLERVSRLYSTKDRQLRINDRSIMAAELTRLRSFKGWPHMNYKWAIPKSMAEAGFFHQPNSLGDDRVMCFMCNACLINWEPSDEPWSEHERHCPNCPYVKDKYTKNIPLCVSLNTSTARHLNIDHTISCISNNLRKLPHIATATTSGTVLIWNVVHDLQLQFEINLATLIRNSHAPTKESAHFSMSQLPSLSSDDHKLRTNNSISDKFTEADAASENGNSIPKSTLSATLSITAMSFIDSKDALRLENGAGINTAIDEGGHTDLSLICGINTSNESSSSDRLLLVVLTASPQSVPETNGIVKNDVQSMSECTVPPEDYNWLGDMSDCKSTISVKDDESDFSSMVSQLITGYENRSITSGKGEDELSKNDDSSDHAGDNNFVESQNENILQVVKIPCGYNSHLNISFISVSSDNKYVVVVVSPIDISPLAIKGSSPSAVDKDGHPVDGGYVHVYEVSVLDSPRKISRKPIRSLFIDSIEDSIIKATLINGSELLCDSTSKSVEHELYGNKLNIRSDVLVEITKRGQLRFIHGFTLQTIFSCSFHELNINTDSSLCVSLSYCSVTQELCIAFKNDRMYFFNLDVVVHGFRNLKASKREAMSNVDDTRYEDVVLSQELSSKLMDVMSLASSLRCRSVADSAQIVTPNDWITVQPSMKRESLVNLLDDSNNWCVCKYDAISTASLSGNYLFELVLSRPYYVSHVNVKVVLPNELNKGRYEFKGALTQDYDCLASIDGSFSNTDPTKPKFTLDKDDSSKAFRAKISSVEFLMKKSNVLYFILSVVDNENRQDDSENSSKTESDGTVKSECGLMLYLNVYSFQNNSNKDVSARYSLFNSERLYNSIIATLIDENLRFGNCSVTDLTYNHQMACCIICLKLVISILAFRLGENTRGISYIERLQLNLGSMVKNSLIFNCRSCAHLFARLFVQCLTNLRYCGGKHLTRFKADGLNALLDVLPYTKKAASFEALQWYFLLMTNCVNEGNVDEVFGSCCQFLLQFANTLPLSLTKEHLQLRSWFGLYGNPLESSIYSLPATFQTSSFNSSLSDRDLGSKQLDLDRSINTAELTSNLDTFVAYKDYPAYFLEAEPLYCKCHTVSCGARIEVMKGGKPAILRDSYDTIAETIEYYDDDAFPDTPESFDDYMLSKKIEQLTSGDDLNMKSYGGFLLDHKKAKASQMLHRDLREAGLDSPSNLPDVRLSPPPSLVLVVEKIFSGARHYVILDFGRSVALTDVIIPSCSYMSTVYIDAWLEGESERRLSISTEIGKKNLILNDMVPPFLCRFVKISFVACSVGVTSTNVRMFVGSFYGSCSILPWQTCFHRVSTDYQNTNLVERNRTLDDYRLTLNRILDDVYCQYEIACNRFRELLDKRTSGFSIQTSLDRSSFIEAYCMCTRFQLQLNTGLQVLRRMNANELESGMRSYDYCSGLCLHLVNTLLLIAKRTSSSIDATSPYVSYMTMELSKSIFKSLCICGPPFLCIRTGSLLLRICGSQPWWGEFLADMLYCCYNSIHDRNLHGERLFSLLVTMGRKSMQSYNSHVVLQDVLKFTYKVLTAGQENDGQANRSVDFNLLSWVVIFFSEILDAIIGTTERKSEKDRQFSEKSKWNFLLIKEASSIPMVPLSDAKHKLKRSYFAHVNKGGYKTSQQTKEKNNTDDKQTNSSSASTSTLTDLWEPSSTYLPLRISRDIVKPVAKELMSVILSLDVFQCEEIFTVICMVVARLCLLSSPAIVLTELMTEDQLVMLLRQAMSHQQTAPWASHSLTCLLLDVASASSKKFNANALPSLKRRQAETVEKSKSSSDVAVEGSKGSKSSSASKVEQSQAAVDTVLDEPLNESMFTVSYDGVKSNSDNTNAYRKTDSASSSTIENKPCMDLRLNDQMGQMAEMELIALSADQALCLSNCMQDRLLPILDSNGTQFSGNLGDNFENSNDSTASMLSKVLNSIFKKLDYGYDELKFLLKIWLRLSALFPVGKWKYNDSSLVMSEDTIEHLIEHLCNKASVAIPVWHLVCKCLIVIYESYDYTPDDALLKLLISFFSATNSADRNELKIGQSVVASFNQLLEALSSRDCDDIGIGMKKSQQLLLKVVLYLTVLSGDDLARPNKGVLCQQSGLMDAQLMLLKYMLKNFPTSISELDFQEIVQLYRNTSRLVLYYVVLMTPTTDSYAILYEQILLTLLAYCTKLARLPITDSSAEIQLENRNSGVSVASRVLDEADITVLLLLILNQIDDKYIGMKMSGGVALKLTKHKNHSEMVVSIADWILMLMCALFKGDEQKLVKAIIQLFGGAHTAIIGSLQLKRSMVDYMSDALFLFVQLVLEHDASRAYFMKLDGGEVLCRNFLTSTSSMRGVAVHVLPPISDLLYDPQIKSIYSNNLTGSYVNFAPFCKISCPSSGSSSPNILLTSSLRSRRPRSALWSYQFGCGENSCDLVLELPHVVLLSEIQITPYVYSCTNCPSAAVIEISEDKGLLSPVTYPMQCFGMKVIKLKLSKPEIARCIRVQLQRPRDSDSIGLMQVAVLGRLPFSICEQNATSPRINENLKSSLYWLGLLHSCLEHELDDTCIMIYQKAAMMPSFISNCVNLFGIRALSSEDHLKIEQLLLKIVANSSECALSLLRILLYQNENSQLSVTAGSSSAYMVYQLGISDVSEFNERISVIVQWLKGINSKSSCILLRTLASAFWQFRKKECCLRDKITVDLIKSLCTTALSVNHDRDLQRSIALVVCAICHTENSFISVVMDCLQIAEAITSKSYDGFQNRLMFASYVCQSPHVIDFILRQTFMNQILTHLTEYFELLADHRPELVDYVRKIYPITIAILNFLGELCTEPVAQKAFGDDRAQRMWKVIIKGLCLRNLQEKSLLSFLPKSDRMDIETSVILLIKRFTSLNFSNQQIIVDIMYDILEPKVQYDGKISHYPRRCIVPNFLRKLLAQVILKDDSVNIQIRYYKPLEESSLCNSLSHPRFSVDRSKYLFEAKLSGNLYSSISWVLKQKDAVVMEKKLDDAVRKHLNKVNAVETDDFGVKMISIPANQKSLDHLDVSDNCDDDDDGDEGSILVYNGEFVFSLNSKAKNVTFSQLLQCLISKGLIHLPCPFIELYVWSNDGSEQSLLPAIQKVDWSLIAPIPSFLTTFIKAGCARLLGGRIVPTINVENIYDYLPPLFKTISTYAVLPMPPHSIIGFGMFLNLNGFAEKLITDENSARWLFRITVGVEIDGEGGSVTSVAGKLSLPLVPFTALESLLNEVKFSSNRGLILRTEAFELGIMHLLVTCLSLFSHIEPPTYNNQTRQGNRSDAMTRDAASGQKERNRDNEMHYLAKGIGFGTGSTTSNWDVDQLLTVQQVEESHMIVILKVLACFLEYDQARYYSLDSVIKSRMTMVLKKLRKLFEESSFVSFISTWLRNDSVLDIAHHIPMYQSLLRLVRNLARWPLLVPLLVPKVVASDTPTGIVDFIRNLRNCVEIYLGRLRPNKKNPSKDDDRAVDNDQDSDNDVNESEDGKGVQSLLPDLLNALETVENAISSYVKSSENYVANLADVDIDINKSDGASNDRDYISAMTPLQFGTHSITTETDENETIFNVRYYYSSAVLSAIANGSDAGNPARARRLAQEAAGLLNSLPMSASSGVYVRCDEERLDVMKVLVTGPSGTPYANGCFEFDAYFPPDYPNVPMQITLMTTGNHTIRFNPNLYNNGKVCLSILNTWLGRPEEKWSPQTSNFLQVLVSIQSLILVSEPYFNEPGYERLYNTPHGQLASLEYNANIRQATVRWAMLEQLRDPSSCFDEVISTHFTLKKNEILQQCNDWIQEYDDLIADQSKKTPKTFVNSLEQLKRHVEQLREEFKKL